MQVNSISQNDKTNFGIKLDPKNIRELGEELGGMPKAKKALVEILDAFDNKGFPKTKAKVGDIYTRQEEWSTTIDYEDFSGVSTYYCRDVEVTNPILAGAKRVFQIDSLHESEMTLEKTLKKFLNYNEENIDKELFKVYADELSRNRNSSVLSRIKDVLPELRLNGTKEDALIENVNYAKNVDKLRTEDEYYEIKILTNDISAKQKKLEVLTQDLEKENTKIDKEAQSILEEVVLPKSINNEMDEIVSKYS